LTTGNFGGFDLFLRDPAAGRIVIATGPASLDIPIAEIGAEPTAKDAGGLGRRLSVVRLPETLDRRSVRIERGLPRAETGDSAFYVSVFQEDGYQAWSSPIYLIP
jgi:hypothetical protein